MTIDKNKNNAESVENKKKLPTKVDFYNSFVKEAKDDIAVVDEIFSNDTVTTVVKKKMKAYYAKFEQEHTGFELDIDKITVEQLRMSFAAPFMDLQKKRKALLGQIHYDFVLDETEAKEVDTEVRALSDDKLKKYLASANERNKFLKEKGHINLERKTTNMVQFFKDILIPIDPKYRLTKEDEKIVMQLMDAQGMLKKMNEASVVAELFQLSYIKGNKNLQKTIIERFIPTISLKEIKEYEIFGKIQTPHIIDKLRDDAKQELLDKNFINDTNIDAVMNTLTNDEIFVSTATIFSDNSSHVDVSKYVEHSSEFQEEFFADYNGNLNYKETEKSRELFPNGYTDFTQKMAELQNFSGIDKFKRGNYLVLQVARSLGSSKEKETHQVYFKIADEGKDNDFVVKLINAGQGEIDFCSELTLTATYANFVDLFKNGIELDDNKYAITSSAVHTQKEIQDLVATGHIKSKQENISPKEKSRRAAFENLQEDNKNITAELNKLYYTKIPEISVITGEILKREQDLAVETDENKKDEIRDAIIALKKERSKLITEKLDVYDEALQYKEHPGDIERNIQWIIAGKQAEYEKNPTPELQEEIQKLLEEREKLLALIPEDKRLNEETQKEFLALDLEFHTNDNREQQNILSFDYNYLLELLDDVDPTGSQYELKMGTSFVTKKGAVFTIINNPEADGEIEIYSITDESTPTVIQEQDYEFFYDVFQEHNCKRLSDQIVSHNNLLELLGTASETSDVFKNLEMDDTEKKWTKKDTENEIYYDYLIGENNEILYLKRFPGTDRVEIELGEFDDGYKLSQDNKKIETYSKKEAEKLGKKEGDKKKNNIISIYENSQRSVPLSWVLTWAKHHKAQPFSETESVDQADEKDTGETKKGFWTGVLNAKNIPEMLAGLKLGVDALGEYLKEGTDERSAQFAQSVYGKVLPEQVALDLQSRMEGKQKERAEQYITKLGQLETQPAMNLVMKWITTTNSPEYLKEAALLFMAQKYGYLNAKKQLPNKLGTYTWYKAFGGQVNSAHFKGVKARFEDGDEAGNFTEERLVFDLIKQQSTKKMRPYRRGKLYKELEPFLEQGKKKEYDDGINEGKSAKNIKQVNGMAFGELESNVPDHAMGLLEEAFNKGGSMKELNKIPFIMAFSGMAYSFENYTLNGFKGFTYKSKMVPILNFMNKPSDLKLLNRTILKICDDLQADAATFGGNFGSIKDRAKSIFSKQGTFQLGSNYERTHKHTAILSEVEAFYEEFGDEITRALYMLNTGDESEKGYLGDLVVMKKDEDTEYEEYYNKISSFGETTFNWTDPDMMVDTLPGLGSTGIAEKKSAGQIFTFNQQGGFRNDKYAYKFFDEFKQEIAAIKARQYPVTEQEQYELKHKLLTSKLENMFVPIISKHANMLSSIFGNTSSEIYKFGSIYGLNLLPLAHGGNDKTILFKEYAEQILGHDGTVVETKQFSNNQFDSINDSVTGDVDDALVKYSNKANSDS